MPLNRAMIIGRLGQTPELKYGQSGTAVCSFSVATSESWTDKQSGQKQEKTEWHRITAFGKLAEICGKYLSKGKQVYVEGKLQTSSYEKDGQTHYVTKIIADNVIFLGSAGSNDAQGQDGGYQPSAQPKTQQYKQIQQVSQHMAQTQDEDIPF